MPRTVTEWFMAVLGGAAIFCFATGMSWMILIALGLVVLIVFIGIASYREVPSKPSPMVAMPDILEYRYPVILREGPVFLAPYIEDMRQEKIEPIKVPFAIDDVRTSLKSDDGALVPGGSVIVEGLLVMKPDYDEAQRFRLFLDNGGREEVAVRALALLAKEIRDKGTEMTWEEIAFAKYVFTAKLIAMLTGLTPPYTSDKEILKEFTDSALESGQADIKQLGVSIVNLDITGIRPEGKLKKFADSAVGEHLQRVAEKADMETVNELIWMQIHSMGYTKETFNALPKGERDDLREKARRQVNVGRGQANETTIQSSGGGANPIPVVNVAAAAGSKPHGSNKPSNEEHSDEEGT
ncbi:hypothetical protein FJY93_01190 [Candidatus Kaiserbacteria bacterium]|nr:hypothetical protein [Candidatus Kaiserbacteria bacterium]